VVSWLAERRLVLACGLLASVPIWVAAADAVSAGWIPLGDKAFTAVRALDVFSRHPPLYGQWSSGATAVLGTATYSPGPLLFWLLALPVRLSWQSALPVTMAVVNTAAVVGALVLAKRRGGLWLMLAAAVAIPVMLASLPADTYADVWNSSAALIPLVLLVFLAWSLGCGEYRLLPVTVVVASFVLQAHLTFVAPVLGLTAVGVVALGISLLGRPLEPVVKRWLLVALGLAALCWIAPAADQVVHRPGNLVLIERAARAPVPKLGVDTGWHALVHAVGVVPWWLQSPRDGKSMAADLSGASTGATLSAVLVLAGLAVALGAGVQRRRLELAVAGALGLALCASIASVAASTPKSQAFTLVYTLHWVAPAGMCVWLLLGWSLVTLWPGRIRETRVATAAGLVAAACVSLAVAVAADPRPQSFQQVRDAATRVEAALPASGTTLVDAKLSLWTVFALADVQGGLAGQLRRDGRKVVLPPQVAQGFGNRYVGPYDDVVRLDADHPPVGGGRVIATIRTPDLQTGKERTVYASIAR
jgi:hypothetical protein